MGNIPNFDGVGGCYFLIDKSEILHEGADRCQIAHFIGALRVKIKSVL